MQRKVLVDSIKFDFGLLQIAMLMLFEMLYMSMVEGKCIRSLLPDCFQNASRLILDCFNVAASVLQ